MCCLASEAKAKGWWHSYGVVIPDWFDLYAGLESSACRLREHSDTLIPALLQTRGYAYEVCRTWPGRTEQERARLVEARLARQVLLERRMPSPPRFEVMLSEAVLLRRVCGSAVMGEQLRHLLELSRLPAVAVRIVPFAAGRHVGAVAGPFVLLDFPPGNLAEPEPSIVYRESLTGALYLDRKPELAAYERIWASLDTLALDEEQSRQLINKILVEVHHG